MSNHVEWVSASPDGAEVLPPGVEIAGYEDPTTNCEINLYITNDGSGAMLTGSKEDVLAWLNATLAKVITFGWPS